MSVSPLSAKSFACLAAPNFGERRDARNILLKPFDARVSHFHHDRQARRQADCPSSMRRPMPSRKPYRELPKCLPSAFRSTTTPGQFESRPMGRSGIASRSNVILIVLRHLPLFREVQPMPVACAPSPVPMALVLNLSKRCGLPCHAVRLKWNASSGSAATFSAAAQPQDSGPLLAQCVAERSRRGIPRTFSMPPRATVDRQLPQHLCFRSSSSRVPAAVSSTRLRLRATPGYSLVGRVVSVMS